MFTSLRARLWLSYALLVLIALVVVAVFLFIYLVRNPLASRAAVAQLREDSTLILKDQSILSAAGKADLQLKSEEYDRLYSARVLIVNRNREVLADSRLSAAAGLVISNNLRTFLLNPTLRDKKGQVWLVTLSRISDNRFLLLAVPRPRVPVLTVLADEMIPVFSVAGITALFVSLVLAYLLARWIALPLQDVIYAASSFPAGRSSPLKPRGPHEVQELTQAFNEMSTRVQSSQKSQRDFVANVSHELKTPLTSIQGFAQAILDGTADSPEERKQAANVIFEEAGRMHRLVLDLLDLARLEAGTAEFQHSSVNLRLLLDNIIEKFSLQAKAAGVEIRLDEGGVPILIGDGDRLAQVFTNLVDNALKHTPERGRITLRTLATSSEVQVEVADTGSGIPPGDLPHIFERFYQADPSRQGGQKHGAGLGLAIAREIVQAHGGTISVRSALGQGSCFAVHLPLPGPESTTAIRRRN